MQLKEVTSESQKETMQLGARLAKLLKPGDIVCLYGDLGTGKTTFVKGMAKGLKISETEVHSPTFVLMNLYEGRVPLFHFDFYRLDDIQQIGMIGYDEFLYDDGIAVVEWAEKLKSLTPKEYLHIQLKHQNHNKRLIRMSARGQRYQQVIENIK